MATTTVLSKIKVRRGPSADFIGGSGVVLDEGELGFVLDTRELFIGYGSTYFPAGNMRLISELDGLDRLSPAVANYSMQGNRITDVGRAIDAYDAATLLDLQEMVQGNVPRVTQSISFPANTGSPANCMTDPLPSAPADTSLNAIAGEFTAFRVNYTVLRGSAIQIGTLDIADNGSATALVDESIEVPAPGAVGINFSSAIVLGIRVLRYVSTAGAAMTMRYSIDRWV